MDSSAKKEVLAKMLPGLIRVSNASRVAFICEMWMIEQKSTNLADDEKRIKDQYKQYGQIKNMPQKVESLMLLIWSKYSTITEFWKIDRSVNPPVLIKKMDTEQAIKEMPLGAIFQNPYLNL